VDEEFGIIDKSLLTDFESVEELEKHYFTKKGDILIRLNEPFTAIYIQEDTENILIPSYFIKLEITDKDIEPWYLLWYLNNPIVKREFLKIKSGTLIQSINQKLIKIRKKISVRYIDFI